MSYFSSFESIPSLLKTIAIVSFAHTVLALTLPTDGERTDNSWAKVDTSFGPSGPFAINSNKPQDNPIIAFDLFYKFFGSVPLVEKDLSLAALYCAARYAAEEAPVPNGLCFRPGYEKVKIHIDIPASNRRRDIAVYGIAYGFLQMVTNDNKFKRLEVKIVERRTVLGTLTFAPGTEGAGIVHVNSLDPFKGIKSHASTLPVLIDGVVAERNISITKTQPAHYPQGSPQGEIIGIDPQSNPSINLVQEPAENTVWYDLQLKPTGQTGLTLRAYTIAAAGLFLTTIADGGKATQISIDKEREYWVPAGSSPITLVAGYTDVKKRDTDPRFTLYGFLLAVAEIPPILLEEGARIFDFFECRLLADTIPVGNIWTRKGIAFSDKTTFR